MNDELVFVIQSAGTMSAYFMVFAVTAVAWVVCEAVLIFRDRRESIGASDKNTVILLILVLIAMAVGIACSGIKTACLPGDRDTHFAIAASIMWAGMVLRFWAISTLGNFFSTVINVQHDHRVITDGPYRYIRHPSYSGALLVLIGIGIAFGNIIGLVLGMALVIVGYHNRINVEERVLDTFFGSEYRQYAKATKKLIPFIY